MKTTSIKPSLLLVSILISIYFITAKGHLEVSDSVFSLRTAQSMIENGSLAIAASATEDAWIFRTPSGTAYSKYGIGLPLLWVPYGIAAKVVSSMTGIKTLSVMDFLVSFYNIFFAAGACTVFFYLIEYFCRSIRLSLLSALILGLCTMCWRFGVSDFSEATQMFFLLAACCFVVRNTPGLLLAGSLSFCLLVMVKIFNIVYLPVLIVFILIKNRSNPTTALKRAGTFALFPIVGLACIAWLNFARFGNIFETGYGAEAGMFSAAYMIRNAAHILFSADDGVFFFSPVLLAGIFGYGVFIRKHRLEAILFLSIILIAIVSAATWHSTESRFIVPVIPLILAPIYLLLTEAGWKRPVVVLLAAISLFWQVVLVLQPRAEYQYITDKLVDRQIAERMPSRALAEIILLRHKLFKQNNIYALSEFGLSSDEEINTSSDYHGGLNLWYCRLAGKFNLPLLRFLPVLFLPVIIIGFKKVVEIIRNG